LTCCYRVVMGMTREDRRTLTIEAVTSSGRDERIARAVHALGLVRVLLIRIRVSLLR
jgi:hypothetical protein